MTKVIDGIIKEWGDRLFYKPVKGRKTRNIVGGRVLSKHKASPMRFESIRAKINYTVSKAPEVMVKISGGGKNMRHIKAHLDYISRKGLVEMEDENGDIYIGKDQVNEVRDAWSKGRVGIPIEGEKRREAFNVILSMPPGTNREAVKNAAREFAREQFNNHQYVFAAHDDESHPHVHLAIKAIDKYCIRMNPRKADLQQWRELFADKLRDQGIIANATPRRTRGVIRKPDRQIIRQIEKRSGKSIVRENQKAAVLNEIRVNKPHENPAEKQIIIARKKVTSAYGKIARELVKSNDPADKLLAVKIVKYIKNMPEIKTLHQKAIESIKNRQQAFSRHESYIRPDNEKNR